MKVHRLRIPGLAVVEPAVHADARGAFDHRVRYTARSAISPGKA